MKARQCHLVTGQTHLTTWVPSRLARKGKKLVAKNDVRVWTVDAAYKIELDAEEIRTDWKVGGM